MAPLSPTYPKAYNQLPWLAKGTDVHDMPSNNVQIDAFTRAFGTVVARSLRMREV